MTPKTFMNNVNSLLDGGIFYDDDDDGIRQMFLDYPNNRVNDNTLIVNVTDGSKFKLTVEKVNAKKESTNKSRKRSTVKRKQ